MWWRIAVVAFLVAHGLVHIAVWGTSKPLEGTNPGHSWLLGDNRSMAIALMTAATGLFVFTGVLLLFHAAWWQTLAVVSGGVSLLLVAVFPAAIPGAWLIAPVTINAGIIASIVWLDWPSELLARV
jgi:hypothetical protein